MNDREYIDKRIEASHLALAKTVSDFGAVVSNNNNEIIDLKRVVKDFIIRADKMLDKHDEQIDALEKSDVDIRSTFKGGKWMAGIATTVILSLISTIGVLGYNNLTARLAVFTENISIINVKIDKIQAQTK